MTPPTAVTLLASAAQTSNGTGTVVDLGAGVDTLRLVLDVTAASGTTPTLAVRVETSPNGTTQWRTARAAASVSAVGQSRVAAVVDRYVRAAWTVGGGTPSFTFSLAGEKYQPLANLAVFRRYHAGGVFTSSADEALEPHLASGSDQALSYLAARYAMPLSAWGDDVRKRVCSLAAWSYLSESRGFNPEAGSDQAVRLNYEDAVRWFKQVALSQVTPQGVVDATPDEEEEEAYIVTSARRGW